MSKEKININDFNLFYDIVKSLKKMSNGIKFTVNDCGVTVYAKNDYSKCELTSNSITSSNELSFCIGDLDVFLKLLTTLKDIYRDGGLEDVNMFYDKPFIRIESKKFKTKISTVEEGKIANSISTKVKSILTSQIDFTTSSSIIKSVCSHSYICNGSSMQRVYLSTDKEMENNVMIARIGNDENELENELSLELGLITNGEMDDRKVILDFSRLEMLNMINSDEIKVTLAKERPVLITKTSKNGENGTFFNIDIYVFMMVK